MAADLPGPVWPTPLRVLGPDHPNTLAARNDLALCVGGGQTAQTADLPGLLADERRVLGPDHPDTLAARNDLAQMLGRRATRPDRRASTVACWPTSGGC